MWPALMAAVPGILSAGKGIWDSFGHHKNPATAANHQLDQTAGQVKPYYDPYINAGRDSLNTLKDQYGQLTNDPAAKLNQFGAGYKQSPGYANTLREALAGSDAASARGGSLGTPMHQQNSAEVGGDVANKDYEEYLNHVIGLYGQGLQGNQGLENQGYGASTDYGNLLANINQQKANFNYAGQAGQNQQNATNFNNISGGLAQGMQGYNDYNSTQNLMNWLKQNQRGGQ